MKVYWEKVRGVLEGIEKWGFIMVILIIVGKWKEVFSLFVGARVLWRVLSGIGRFRSVVLEG